MQGGGPSTKEIGCLPDPFVPGQYVTNCIGLKEENKPADKAEVPICLSFIQMNVVPSSYENCGDVSGVFHIALYVYSLCKCPISKWDK